MQQDENQNIIAITMGCPASIGPEIILKYFQDRANHNSYQPIIIGDLGVLRRCAQDLNLPALFSSWHPGSTIDPATIPVFECSSIDCSRLSWGTPSIETGKAMAEYIIQAIRLIQEGICDGMVTCPISKSSLNQAGYDFPGHTEMLAHLTNTAPFGMMMAGKTLRVTLVTIHCALTEVAEKLSIQSITEMIELTKTSLQKDFAIKTPRIAVAGLNPHAGEDGLFGLEEQQFIQPAIERINKHHEFAFGPFPPDTIFNKCMEGAYDAIVCMYHDQGLIPFKLVHFADGVNITIGLPIVRTSVDHGTAYDIAGKGIADPTSLVAAIDMAGTISVNRKVYQTRI